MIQDIAFSRRHLLQAGAIAGLGLSLPRLLRADTAPVAKTRRADACILIFLNGGPSHLDMWDMKPAAPVEIRGEFRPVATSLPGVQLSEHLPRLSRLAHQVSLVRSVRHSVNNAHAAAVYAALTGHDRGERGGGAKPTDNPAIGSVVARMRPPERPVVPYVALPFITKEGAGGPPQPGFFGGFMGRTHDPLFVLNDPNAPNFQIPGLSPDAAVSERRLSDRAQLRRSVGGPAPYSERVLAEMDEFQQRAVDLLTSPGTQQAFRIEQEPAAVRTAYGRNIYGQSVLLSRRLIEAGARVACVSWAPDANATWDTHGNNFTKLRSELLPQLDAALSSLLNDLIARDMLERTLVVVMGEFGRTPRINGSGGGRDHWNFCYSMLLAGGGIKPGYIHGASDRIGAYPSANPVSPADLVATIYECLGIPKDLELYDNLRRPFQLVPWGDVIGGLLA
ncbi:MAG: DUF1501 domain-containing protein [Gemmataceae bacterium]